MDKLDMEKVVNLCKQYGFIFQGSEIYGGLANTWDFGPVGVELKKNIIKKQKREINNRQIYSYMHDIFGVDILNIFDLRQEDEDRLQGKKAVENADERN